jgi:carbon storage regulator
MLVLCRKVGEKVRLGENVVVTVLESYAGQVRLGFEASPDVPIRRQEVIDREQRKQSDARRETCGV